MSDHSKRIQFEFPPDAVERLDRIKQETNSSSYAELVRNALRVYEWLIETQKKGFDIGVVKDDQLVRTVEFLY
jgi:metal-responsive CopG/Arc/MetJ family transcriptional regulator